MCAAARARARALSMFIPKHMPHLCGTETGVHGGVPQRHLLQRHLRNSKRRQSPRASCARRARALRSAAQSTAATVIVNSRSPCWGARGRCRSGAQRAPGSPACSIVASCPAASGAMTATSTAVSGDEKGTDDSVPANIIVFFYRTTPRYALRHRTSGPGHRPHAHATIPGHHARRRGVDGC